MKPAFFPLVIIVLLVDFAAGYGLQFIQQEGAPPTIGRVEKVYVKDADFLATARIDTGAGVSSINAEIITVTPPKKEGGAETVTFKVVDDEKHIITLTRDIIEWQNIKKKGGKEGYVRRPVVMMKMCVAGKRIETRVNLADRAQFLYPVLIGRNTLKRGDFLIDPSKKFTHKPTCPKKKG